MSDAVTFIPVRKLSIGDMQNFVSGLKQRWRMGDGVPCARIDMDLSPEDHFAIEKLEHFLIWAAPHEAEFRKFGKKR